MTKKEELSLNKLKPAEWNPRLIKDGRFKNLCKSIEEDPEFMQLRPVLATKDGTIYAGNMRYRAAKHLGWKTIPAIITDIDETLAKKRAIKDNSQFGEWTDDLAEVIDELQKAGVDIETLGLDDKELQSVIQQLQPEVVEDEPPPVPDVPKSKLGDLYQLGNHRLLCGDATKVEDVERLMDGERADMVFTDPPYGVSYDGGVQTKRDKLIGDDTTELYMPACQMAYDFSVDAAPLYLWHAGVKGIAAAAAAAAAAAHYEIRCEIVWNKNQAQFGALSAQYKQKHEPAYYCFKRGKTVNWCGPTNEVTVWDVDRSSVNEFHPTQKPVALASRALGNHAAETCLDLFGGSGSTLIACEQLNRKCYMMELDPKYVDVIVKRWETLTGKKAKKLQ